MKVIKTPIPQYKIIFYENGDQVLDFYEDDKGIMLRKIMPANMKPSEKERFVSAWVYSR